MEYIIPLAAEPAQLHHVNETSHRPRHKHSCPSCKPRQNRFSRTDHELFHNHAVTDCLLTSLRERNHLPHLVFQNRAVAGLLLTRPRQPNCLPYAVFPKPRCCPFSAPYTQRHPTLKFARSGFTAQPAQESPPEPVFYNPEHIRLGFTGASDSALLFSGNLNQHPAHAHFLTRSQDGLSQTGAPSAKIHRQREKFITSPSRTLSQLHTAYPPVR